MTIEFSVTRQTIFTHQLICLVESVERKRVEEEEEKRRIASRKSILIKNLKRKK